MEYENLVGRPFKLGTTDCFAILRDFYKQNYDIEIRNYARPNDWDSKEFDLIGSIYELEGFHKVSDWTLANLHPGDVLCLAIGSPIANHLAIYLGGNKILHHLTASRSTTETLRDFWRKSICYVLRHPDVEYTPEVKPSVSIMEIINERNRITPPETV